MKKLRKGDVIVIGSELEWLNNQLGLVTEEPGHVDKTTGLISPCYSAQIWDSLLSEIVPLALNRYDMKNIEVIDHDEGLLKESEFIPMINCSSPSMFNIRYADDGFGNKIPYQSPDPIEEDDVTYTFEKFKRSIRESVDLMHQKMPFDWYLVANCGTCHDKKRIALKDIPFKHFDS